MSYLGELANIVQNDFAELYDFAIAGQHWRYTSYSENVNFDGNEYLSATIKRTEWSSEGELKPVQVRVTVPLTDFVAKFVANYPIQRVHLEITRVFLDEPASYFKIFGGDIISVVITKSGAELSCESASLLFSSLSPRVLHQAFCNHSLFDSGCKLSDYSYKVEANGVVVSGSTIQHSVFDTYVDGYFAWGYVKTTNLDYRLITNHIGNTLTIQTPFPALALVSGGDVVAWRGCDKAKSTCQNKFGNFDNFLGMPFIPSHNPAIFGIEYE